MSKDSLWDFAQGDANKGLVGLKRHVMGFHAIYHKEVQGICLVHRETNKNAILNCKKNCSPKLNKGKMVIL